MQMILVLVAASFCEFDDEFFEKLISRVDIPTLVLYGWS